MRILVISPHADDETLGAGGTLLKYKNQGHNIFWLNVTDMKEEYGYTKERVAERTFEIKSVEKMYGFDKMFNLQLQPAKLDVYEKSYLVQKIASVIEEIKPDTLILPYLYDVHSDHKVVFEASYSSTKAFRFPYVKRILCMEVLSETDYAIPEHSITPNYYIDITPYMQQKIDIMKMYKSEIGEAPFPRSEQNIRGLAQYRGGSANVRYAEAFQIIKMID